MNMGKSVVGWAISEHIEITWMIPGLEVEKKTVCSMTKSLMIDRELSAGQADEGSNSLAVIKWASRKR